MYLFLSFFSNRSCNVHKSQSLVEIFCVSGCNCRLNLLRASTFNFERLDMLRDSIRHPRKKLLSFAFTQRFNIQFRASRYITGLNKTSEKNIYCRLHLLRGSTFNFERLDILRDSIRHPSKNLLSFEFAQSICFQF